MHAAARLAVRGSLQVKSGERVLIITNPDPEVSQIATALYDEVRAAGGRPNLVWQEVRGPLEFMDEAVRGALLSEPEVYVSLSVNKLGRDPQGLRQPYRAADGGSFDSLTSFLIHGKQVTRGFWSPGITRDLFQKTVPADYAGLTRDCRWLEERLNQALAVRVTAPGGTELTFSTRGRRAFIDDGDYSRPGTGGNLPAGETYVSPVVGSTEGRIVFDGSMATGQGTLFLAKPITVDFENGFIAQIAGGEEAEALADTIRQAEDNVDQLPAQQRDSYSRNARGLGELGIGVNPLASISGVMLVDEKAARTCHLAIGSNYDHDGPALIHLDGLVKEPTIELELADGGRLVLLIDGELNR